MTIKLPCSLFVLLSWKFVYQRPQHLLSRFTKKYAVLLYIRVYLKSLRRWLLPKYQQWKCTCVIVPHLNTFIQGKQNEKQRVENILKNVFEKYSIKTGKAVGSSFYKIPQSSTITKWADSVSENFRFTFKLGKEITHSKDLNFNKEEVAAFLNPSML